MYVTTAYLKYTITVLFVVFALVQYNDADWYIWGPAYLLVAALYAFPDAFKSRKIVLMILLGFLLWAASYVPAFITWLKDGAPSITGTMKAENMEVELVREFLGLVLCIIYVALRLRKPAKP
ncbi:MAG: transmembrane 220 family protein [Saprospiraceae bacterium]|nr:transmembrane 220 family protein [Saprospiraceae bacterium]